MSVGFVGIKGLMTGFSSGEDDEEFRPFIRRLPGGSSKRASRNRIASANSPRISFILGFCSTSRWWSLIHLRSILPDPTTEFKFWLSATKATLLAIFSTITRATDIPVYWPILLVYFFVLFGLTMKRQITHMLTYKYTPFDIGRKATYGKGKK